jgi:hypothetical protein
MGDIFMPVFMIVTGSLMSLAGLMALLGFMVKDGPTGVPAVIFSVILVLAGALLIVLGIKRYKKKKALLTQNQNEIIGRWQDARGSVSEFKSDGVLLLDGSMYWYRASGSKLMITSKDGVIKASYRMDGDTLYTKIKGRANEWKRIPNSIEA